MCITYTPKQITTSECNLYFSWVCSTVIHFIHTPFLSRLGNVCKRCIRCTVVSFVYIPMKWVAKIAVHSTFNGYLCAITAWNQWISGKLLFLLETYENMIREFGNINSYGYNSLGIVNVLCWLYALCSIQNTIRIHIELNSKYKNLRSN